MGRKKSKAKQHRSGSAGISTNGLSFSSSSSSSSSSKSKLSSIKNGSGVNQIHKLLLCFRHGESLAQITPNKKTRQSDPSLRDAKLSIRLVGRAWDFYSSCLPTAWGGETREPSV